MTFTVYLIVECNYSTTHKGNEHALQMLQLTFLSIPDANVISSVNSEVNIARIF